MWLPLLSHFIPFSAMLTALQPPGLLAVPEMGQMHSHLKALHLLFLLSAMFLFPSLRSGFFSKFTSSGRPSLTNLRSCNGTPSLSMPFSCFHFIHSIYNLPPVYFNACILVSGLFPKGKLTPWEEWLCWLIHPIFTLSGTKEMLRKYSLYSKREKEAMTEGRSRK